jgi:subtilisin family serine protease
LGEKIKKSLLLTLTILLSFSLVFLLLNSKSASNQEVFTVQEEYVPNEVLVKFKAEVSRGLIRGAVNIVQGKIITYLGREISTSQWDADISSFRSFLQDPDLFHIKVPEAVGTEKAIYLLNLNPNVEYAQKNLIYHAQIIPYDTYFSSLWGMNNTGQTGGTVDADIDAPEAWDIFTGSSNVVVAVIDTGIDYNHVDLAANIWINEDEIPNNGIDDDNNGYVDDVRGWNFVSNNNDPMDDMSYLTMYHGTHVSGTIGAIGNNGEGVTGVNWNVKLMAVKFLNQYGVGTTANAISAIDYSTTNNAHLSNNSWGNYTYDQALYNAITRARNAGKLFVAAAGNDNLNTDNYPFYPACYYQPNIIAVLATDHNDNRSGFSNYGPISIDLGAPGGSGPGFPEVQNIYSTKRYDAYQFLYGTSMAVPHVAGVAALAWGKCPPLTWSQIKTRILNKVDVLGSLNNKCVSNGRLNAYKTIYDPSPPNGTPSSLNSEATAWDLIDLSWQDNSSNEIGFEIQRKRAGDPDFSYLKSVDGNVTYAQDTTATSGITFYYKVRAYNMAGLSSFSNQDDEVVPDTSPDPPGYLEGYFDWVNHQVELTWSDSSNNEQGFIIERRSEWEPSFQEIGSVGPNVTTFYDPNVSWDTIYHYRVKVYNPRGYAYSQEVIVYVG